MEGVIDQWLDDDENIGAEEQVRENARGYHVPGMLTTNLFRSLPVIETHTLRASETGTLCLACLISRQCTCRRRRKAGIPKSILKPNNVRKILKTIRWLRLEEAAVIDMNRLGSADRFTANGESAVGSSKPVAPTRWHMILHNSIIMPKLRQQTSFQASHMTERQVYEVYSNFFSYLHCLASRLTAYPTMVQMCNTVIRQVVPLLIPPSDYAAHMAYINSLVDIGVAVENTVLNTSRQVGKTTIIAMVLTAFLASVVRHEQKTVINIVAQDRSMEVEILAIIKGNMKVLVLASQTGECPTPPEVRDDNNFVFSVARNNIVTGIKCLAPTDSGLRGTSADIIWLDELFFIDPPSLVDTASTVAATAGHHVIGTTTPNVERAELRLYKVATGEPVPGWTGRDLGLACLACQQNNVNTHCTHRLFFLPPWKTFPELVASALTALLRIELWGISCRRMVDIIFKPEETRFDIWPANKYSTIQPYFNMVFISADPGAGARRSANAFMATMYDQNTNSVVVLGMDNVVAEHSATSDLNVLLAEFLQRVYSVIHIHMTHLQGTIRVMPLFEGNHSTILVRDALMVFADSVDKATHLPLKLVNPPIELLGNTQDPKDPSIGSAFRLRTTSSMKWDAITSTQEMFMRRRVYSVEDRHIATTGIQQILTSTDSKNRLISTVSRTPRPDTYGAELKSIVREQLLAFRLTTGGRLSGKTGSSRDDLAMAMFINVYWFMVLSVLGVKQPTVIERLLSGRGYCRDDTYNKETGSKLQPFMSGIALG